MGRSQRRPLNRCFTVFVLVFIYRPKANALDRFIVKLRTLMRICRKHRDMAPANNFSNKEMYGMGGSHTFPCNLVVKIRMLNNYAHIFPFVCDESS